jgi:hypothetical protein
MPKKASNTERNYPMTQDQTTEDRLALLEQGVMLLLLAAAATLLLLLAVLAMPGICK